jgi:signal peptide peptidase SppA
MSDPARKYSHIVRAVRQRPWAIDPASKEWAAMLDIVDLRAAGTSLTDDEIQTRIAAAVNGPRNGAAQGQGVAIIPVYGVISHRMDLMSQMSGGTSVQGLQRAFRSALADPEIGAIIFDVDSPGGSVEGIFEFAEEIFAARGQKHMVSVANSTMASAAYLLGSQADEVVASPSSLVGSIGVIGQHVDVSAQDEMLGEKVTLITAGEGKGNANAHVPLSDEARAELQSMADDYYALFVKAVAAGRGVKASQVTSEWKAQVFTARKAKTAGLVNRIETLDQTISRMILKVDRTAGSAIGAAYLQGLRAGSMAATTEQRAQLEEHDARLQAEAEPVAPSEPDEHLPDGPVEVIANADDERRRRLSVARANAALAIAHVQPFKEVQTHV